MRATVISMASAKGGSGKTIITAAFGTLLASLGKRVLMIDTDAATNGLSLFYIKPISNQAGRLNRPPIGLFESASPAEKLHFIEVMPNLFLLPATYGFRNTEKAPPSTYRIILESLIENQRYEFDFIFLDAQAGSDVFAEIAVSEGISDQVVIVSEYDPMSAAGVERLKAIFQESLTYPRTWVLLNKMLPDFIKSFSDFLEIAKYLSPLPWNADVVRAYARRALPLDTQVGNEYTIAIVQTLRSLLDDVTRNDLDEWLSTQAIELKAPIQTQLEEAREALAVLREQQEQIRRRRRFTSVLSLGVLITLVMAGFLLYLILGSGDIAVRAAVAAPVLAVTFAAIPPLLIFLSRETYEKELDQDIAQVRENVRRLSELSDLSFEDLVRKSQRPV